MKILGRGNKTQDNLLSVRELQADEVQHLESLGLGEILDELAELHLAVRLPSHIYHIDDFVGTWTGDIRGRGSVVSDSGLGSVDETYQRPPGISMCFHRSSPEVNWHQYGRAGRGGGGEGGGGSYRETT